MGSANHILALDQGTTSSRAMVFDEFARERSLAQQPTTQLYPRPGWVNQDAAEIWATTLETARAALHQAALSGHDVAGIGIVNQRETLIVWDRETSKPVSPAIVWQSRQSQPQVEALLARGMGATYQSKTGLVPDAYFTASKLAWLLEEDADLRRRAEAGELLAGTVDSWLLWNLTGGAVHATDVSNASRTMLFDIRTLEWSTDLMPDMAIPPQMLPRVVASAGISGLTVPELFGDGDSRLRDRRRSAGGALWADLLRPGGGQEHVWHGLISAHEYGRRIEELDPPAAFDDRLADRPTRSTTRWRVPSSSAAQPWNGCAMGSASSTRFRMSKRSRPRCRIPAE